MLCKKLVFAGIIAAGIAFSQTDKGPAPAQSADPTKFYNLLFTVKEMEGGKVVTSRHYSMMTRNNHQPFASIRVGEKVPYNSNQYEDVGVNIDCHNLTVVDDRLSISIQAEISSAAKAVSGQLPLLRQTKWGGEILVPLRKTTTVFSSDQPTVDGSMQLEVLVTPLN